MAWTEQQNNAINIRNASVIVSAAAGSGKTAVLTERLAQLIADESAGVRADRIIVVTFTNDAASELRKRLDIKLRTLISENPNNRYLLKQQILLQSAKISTINSFCFDLLRDNITEQGITSGFTILDESEDKLLKAKSMDELLNYYCGNEYEKISFLYDKFCLKNDEKLAEVIELADRYLASAAMREKWLTDAVNAFKSNPYESIYYNRVTEIAIKKLKKALLLAEQCCDMLDDIFIDDSTEQIYEKSLAQASEDRMKIETALRIFESGKSPDHDEISFCTSFSRLVTIKKSEPIDFKLRELYKAKRKAFTDLVKSSFSMLNGFEEDFSEGCEITAILAEMLSKYQKIIWEKKCDKNAISFDDGERLVLELLAENDENGHIIQSETACRIADFYDIIMIDEYQDSNNKQDLIFKLISKGYRLSESGEPIYGNNVFVVGDVKQSIYKFRLANPKNFISTLKNSGNYNSGEISDNYAVSLNKNFRSSCEVIDFVNYIFEGLMSEQCGDVVYDDDEKLYFGAEEYTQNNDDVNCRTLISLINTDKDDSDEEEEIISTFNPEAAYTAKRIAEMLASRDDVIMKNGARRPCEPSDFCILIRKKKYTKQYVDELKKRGIEARGEEETGYLASREIAVLLDLLRIIDNPLLDVPLAAVMMSPMYMFELEEIAYLKTLDKNSSLFTIMNSLVEDNTKEISNAFLVERCAEFLQTLNSFRLSAVTMTVGELIGKIYDMTDFISVMQLYTDGDKKRANLRALIQYAKNYESSSSADGSGGLSGFIRYIDRIIENGTDFAQGKISSATGNYVSVKTIHKSKGLEYPFVFLAETTSKIKFDHPSVICSDDSTIGYVLYDQKLMRRYRTIPYNIIIDENNKDIVSEELRLLYVAMTRAKQRLFVNLSYSEKRIKSIEKMIEQYFLENNNIKQLAEHAKCHADWIWMSLLEHSCFSSKIAEYIGIQPGDYGYPSVKYYDEAFEIEFINSIDAGFSYHEEDENYSEALYSEELCCELSDIIKFRYDRTLSETPSKLSVTQITKKFTGQAENFDFKLKRPKFMVENKSLTGAEVGTSIHTFFQYCDFDNAEIHPENELENIVEKGYLSRIQADSVSIENVIAFFRSNLYSRIKNSSNVWREKKFMVAVSDLNIENELMNSFRKSDGMLKGIVDLIFEEDGKLIIVDYKSDRGASAEKLKERYTMQLRLYKSAIELTCARIVSQAYLYSFELKQEIPVDL